MTLPQLKKRLKYFRSLLGIEKEWKITLKWGTSDDLVQDGLECSAICDIKPEYQTATIYLDKTHFGDELEADLIHELLHVLVDGHKPQSGDYDPMHERAINKLQAAISKLVKEAHTECLTKAMNPELSNQELTGSPDKLLSQ